MADRTKALQFWPAPDQALQLAPGLETRQSGLTLASAMKFAARASSSLSFSSSFPKNRFCDTENRVFEGIGIDSPIPTEGRVYF